MLIHGLSIRSVSALKSVSAMSRARSCRLANARTPIASPYDAITGIASRTCSAASPSITTPCRDSRPWIDISGEITNAPPPSRIIAAWNDDSVRSDGLRNKSDSTLPASARGSGLRSSRSASAIRSWISSREKSARSLKRRIVQVLQGCAQALHMLGSQDQRRQETQHVWVRARAGQDVAREQRVSHRGGFRLGLQAQQEAAALHADDRPDDAGGAHRGAHLAHVREQIFVAYHLEHGLDRGARDRAAAEGRAERAGFEVARDLVRQQ